LLGLNIRDMRCEYAAVEFSAGWLGNSDDCSRSPGIAVSLQSSQRPAMPACPSGEIGRHKGLEVNLSPPAGKPRRCSPSKSAKALVSAVRSRYNRVNAEPSPASVCFSQKRHPCEEGVESRRRAPKAGCFGNHRRTCADDPSTGDGEGVLQTTNGQALSSVCAGGESRSGKKIPRLRGRAGSIPASGTILLQSLRAAQPWLACVVSCLSATRPGPLPGRTARLESAAFLS